MSIFITNQVLKDLKPSSFGLRNKIGYPLWEERGEKLYAFECKYSKKKVKASKDFINTYPGSEFSVINQDDYLDYLT